MSLSLPRMIELACLWEVTAPKPGNVHPDASFADLNWEHLRESAAAASPCLALAGEQGVGASVESAIIATRAVVRTNTNLGIALLIAPLAAVSEDEPLSSGIGRVLSRLTVEDACAVYRAIGLAAPSGLGQADAEDIAHQPTQTLTDVMRLATERDGVARQYATAFNDILHFGQAELDRWLDINAGDQLPSIVGLHLSLLAKHPDTLIARKCGSAIAVEASQLASDVLASGWPHGPESAAALITLDQWLRSDGHRRNPGTTADFVAAILFAHIREAVRTGGDCAFLKPPQPGF